MMKYSKKDLLELYTGYEEYADNFRHLDRIQLNTILCNQSNRNIEVIMEPEKYVKYMERIREELKKEF